MARALSAPVRIEALVERFGGELQSDRPVEIFRLASLSAAGPGDLSFLSAARHRGAAATTGASAVIVSAALADALPPSVARILVADPYAHFATIARWFAQQLAPAVAAGVHPTAQVSPEAQVAPTASIGAHCTIEAGAVVEENVRLGAGCHLGREARVGAGSVLHPGVIVYHDCRVGARCLIHAGTVIGADGFGFARVAGQWEKIPQLGAAIIGDDVEIGANCTIDRGALEDTIIGDGCKLDNLIQIAHNVIIGEHTALAACVGVAGSARIGRRCMIGGGAGIVGHLEICDDVVIGGMTMVTRSIRKPGFYTGAFPLMENADWERSAAAVRRLPDLRQRLRRLESGRGPLGGDETDPDS